MDLHIVGAEPTDDERAAVDALLGEPSSSWYGAARDVERDGRAAHGGRRAGGERDLLLPALHAVQDRLGWISRGALNYICRRLSVPPADAWGVVTFYHLFATEPRPPIVAHVCDDIACRLKGAERICQELDASGIASVNDTTSAGTQPPSGGHRFSGASEPAIAWQRSPCLGQCDRAPAALVLAAGAMPLRFELAAFQGAADILRTLDALRSGRPSGRPAEADRLRPDSALRASSRSRRSASREGGQGSGESAEALRAKAEASALRTKDEADSVSEHPPSRTEGRDRRGPQRGSRAGVPFSPGQNASPSRIVGDTLLRRVGHVDPTSLDAYRGSGGYQALARAIEMGRDGVIAEVTGSGLLGRGGAAFPTGRKWAAVAKEEATPHYVVCNADESEPGTFKDRVLMCDDPFAIVEAMTICGFATGSEHGFLYVRGEYPLAEARMALAIAAAREADLLGENIVADRLRRGSGASGFRFDIEIRRGAGAYICGEETALFNSIEGKRGEPRSKPPFPAQIGLFGKPTVVNNVETLVNVLDIVLDGGAAWARVGTKQSAGTRLFCLSGHVARPGLYEVPFGTTLRALLDLAGGVANGRALKGLLLGGAAGMFVGPDKLDLPLTFEDVRAAGATLGSGVVMVFDETTDFADTLGRIAEFFEHESCGQCVPCRVGTVRQREILDRLRSRAALRGVPSTAADGDGDLALLIELGQAMRDASICGLGQTASSAIESAVANLQIFRRAPLPPPRFGETRRSLGEGG